MRDWTVSMVRRAVLSPEAPARKRAARARVADSGAAPAAGTGRWGRAATAEVVTAVAVAAAAATTAEEAAGIPYLPPIFPPKRQREVEAAAPAWTQTAATPPLSPSAARR
jgi:hypothetical protein